MGSVKKELAKKFDQGKPPISLISRTALEQEARVMDYGRNKYGAQNWRKGMEWSRAADAALRHIFAFMDGENTDSETGISHIAHARCCLAFLLDMEKNHPELDDRHGKQA